MSMSTIDQEEMRQVASYPVTHERDTSEVWKWIAASLLGLLMFLGGYLGRGGITRAEAIELVASPVNPYVQDKPALEQRLGNIEKKLDGVQGSLNEQQRRMYAICISLGIDPDNPQHKGQH